jgi:hypothetical protein
LLEDTAGLVAAEHAAGRGRVIVLASTDFMSNTLIGRDDNAIAAANALSYALAASGGDSVAFDEYHLGYGRSETSWGVLGALLFTTPAGWAVLSLTAAGLLYLVYRGRRFGTRLAPSRKRRRSKLEFVESIGATYRAAGANALTYRLLFGWFRRRAARRAGMPASASTAEIARGLALHAGRPAEQYEQVLADCQSATRSPRLSAKQLTGFLNRLARIESEALDAD